MESYYDNIMMSILNMIESYHLKIYEQQKF